MLSGQVWRLLPSLYSSKELISAGSSLGKLRMRSCGIVTLPMVAVILFTGLLTTHASAKAVVGRRSPPVSMSDLSHNLLARAELLKEKEAAAAEQEEESERSVGLGLPAMGAGTIVRYPSREKILNIVQSLDNRETPANYGDMRLWQALWELQQQEAGESEMKKKHRPWEKRLEALAKADGSIPDLSLLEARRRGGPEFNPTGW